MSDIPSPDLAERLREEHDHAREQSQRLEREYEMLLADPGAIQEDRDTIRQVLEEARANHEMTARALARFDEGAYGACARCGEPIGAERLDALPGVDTCIACHGEPR